MPKKKTPIIHPHLCRGCIDFMKTDINPYIYPIKIVEVPLEECDNYTVRGKFVNEPKAKERFTKELAAFGIAL